MEQQIIKTITAPRILLKRTSIKNKVSWEILASSSEDKIELKEIVKVLDEINLDMEKKFGKEKPKPEKKE